MWLMTYIVQTKTVSTAVPRFNHRAPEKQNLKTKGVSHVLHLHLSSVEIDQF